MHDVGRTIDSLQGGSGAERTEEWAGGGCEERLGSACTLSGEDLCWILVHAGSRPLAHAASASTYYIDISREDERSALTDATGLRAPEALAKCAIYRNPAISSVTWNPFSHCGSTSDSKSVKSTTSGAVEAASGTAKNAHDARQEHAPMRPSSN